MLISEIFTNHGFALDDHLELNALVNRGVCRNWVPTHDSEMRCIEDDEVL